MDSLAAGIISLSTSTLRGRIFLCGEKGQVSPSLYYLITEAWIRQTSTPTSSVAMHIQSFLNWIWVMHTILSGSGKETSGRCPGKNRTISFMQHSFWWPALARDVQEFVSVCPTWAKNKTSSSPPTKLLRPVPTPGRPWSHIALLPTIFTIVDCFFKTAQFVPLPKSPTALETAQLVTKHGFTTSPRTLYWTKVLRSLPKFGNVCPFKPASKLKNS